MELLKIILRRMIKHIVVIVVIIIIVVVPIIARGKGGGSLGLLRVVWLSHLVPRGDFHPSGLMESSESRSYHKCDDDDEACGGDDDDAHVIKLFTKSLSLIDILKLKFTILWT